MALPAMERSSGVRCCSCRPTMSISTQNGARFSFRVVFTTKSCFGIPRQGLASAAIAMANWESRSIPFAWLSEKPSHTERRRTLTNRGFDLLAAAFPRPTTPQDHRSERAKHRRMGRERLSWSDEFLISPNQEKNNKHRSGSSCKKHCTIALVLQRVEL